MADGPANARIETDAILDEAARRFDTAEVFEESGESVSVSFEDNRLKEITVRQFRGVGLRVVHDGRIGFASTTDLRDPARLVEMAGASASFGDEAKFDLPAQPAELPTRETYDPAVPDVPISRMVEMGNEGLALSRQTDDAYLYNCGIGRSTHTQRITNSAGLDVSTDSTGMSGSVSVQLVGDDGLLHVGEYKSWSRPFDSVMELARTVLEKVGLAATIVPAQLEAMPMIFTPQSLGNLFGPIGVALSGKLVHKGISVLRDRIGDDIIDPRLTIVDDPTIPYAPATCATDDEGIPARRQPIFEGGVLRTFLTDLQTAGLLGCEPSGHGFRGYGSRPGPGSTNSIIEPGDTSFDDMVAGMERGVIIEQTLGSGQSNTLAGEFSVNLDLGFLVEDGRITGRVKDCMVAGNVYEVLKEVEAIGSEPVWYGSRYAPAIMVGGLKLAAQG